VTEEISIRASRTQRGADIDDFSINNDTAVKRDTPGEVAWDLGDPDEKHLPPKEKRSEEAPPPPPFPGFGGTDEEEEPGPGLDISRFVRGVWKRRWLVAGIALFSILLSGLTAFTLLDHKWEAATVLMLRTHQDKFALGSSTPFKPQEFNLKTLLDTVKLPTTLDAVMSATDISVLRRTLAAAINVSPGKDSNIFQVRVIWDDPMTAAAIANQVASILITRSSSMRRKDAEDVYKYYSAQLDDARVTRRSISAEMQQFQSDTKVSDFDTEIKVLIEELSQLQAEHNIKVAEIGAMRTAQKRLERLIAELPEMVVISTIYRNPLKQRLTDYEWQLQEALSRYTEKNPKVIKLQEKISVLNKMIDDSNDEGAPQNTFAPNKQRSEMQTRLHEMTDELRVKEAQAGALNQTIQGMRENLTKLSSSKKEYEPIGSRLAAAETLEASLISRVDEARVIMLRNEASIELVEAASPPQEPMPSGRKLMVAAGIMLGSGAGLFIALLLELLDPVVRSRRDAMDLTGVELVWELQQIPADEESLIDTRFPSRPLAIMFRRLLNVMNAQLEKDQWRCLAIASVEPQVGRSLVATNLAQTLSLKEQETILVDADLRSPAGKRPSELLGLPGKLPGLWEVLREGASAADLIKTTKTNGLHILGPGNPHQEQGDADDSTVVALGDQQMRRLIDTIEKPYQHLLFDLPPLSALETSVEAAMAIGNLLLVVRSGQTLRSELRETTQMLHDRGINIRAVLLTDVPDELLYGKPTFESRSDTNSQRWRTSRKHKKAQPA
jgi:uncharacterized protein involved in exopolysaccharide biosynthesis/Mrp family chromosome partitioning ATPase